jgi:hypothetical protein
MDGGEISNGSADISNHCLARHCWLFAKGCFSFHHMWFELIGKKAMYFFNA